MKNACKHHRDGCDLPILLIHFVILIIWHILVFGGVPLLFAGRSKNWIMYPHMLYNMEILKAGWRYGDEQMRVSA